MSKLELCQDLRFVNLRLTEVYVCGKTLWKKLVEFENREFRGLTERKNNAKELSWSVKRIGVDMVEIGEG
uniref:Uncharacterized protein n=1 Tax=Salix viminalis TaxID=40686 RepID=A0A6N2MK89_SALVM